MLLLNRIMRVYSSVTLTWDVDKNVDEKREIIVVCIYASKMGGRKKNWEFLITFSLEIHFNEKKFGEFQICCIEFMTIIKEINQ